VEKTPLYKHKIVAEHLEARPVSSQTSDGYCSS